MISPIDFIKEKYITPNKINQDTLCQSLNLGKKTYQDKRGLTLYTAKKFAKFFGLKPILKNQGIIYLALDEEKNNK